MKAWEIAKQSYPSLSRDDFIQQTCPDKMGILDKPEWCNCPLGVEEGCVRCWEREVRDGEI